MNMQVEVKLVSSTVSEENQWNLYQTGQNVHAYKPESLCIAIRYLQIYRTVKQPPHNQELQRCGKKKKKCFPINHNFSLTGHKQG